MNTTNSVPATFPTTIMHEFDASILAIFFFPLLFYFLFARQIRLKQESSTPLPPGPIPWPIVGSLPELLRNKPRSRWILRLMEDRNIACIRLGNVHVIPVNCPEIALEFLKKQDAVFASRPITMATELSTRGFLTVAESPLGEQWKKMRRVVASHVLHSNRIRRLVDKRREEADNLVKYIYNQCTNQHLNSNDNGLVNVRTAAWQYCGNVTRKMLFSKRYFGKGRKDGGPGVEEEEYVGAIIKVLQLLNAFCVSDYLPWLKWFDLDGHERMIREAISIVNKYHDPIVDERIKRLRSSSPLMGGGKDADNNDDGSSIFDEKWEPQDLLDVLISVKDANGKPLLSTDEIKAQAMELVLAAIDNPSNAAEWVLAEMMNQPQILQRAVDEIDSVVGRDELVHEKHLPHLNYVRACARESFRLHPIVPFNIPHASVSDTTVAGYFIPKGSNVLLSRVGLGRNPNVWSDPLKFKPDRHLESRAPVQLTEPGLRFISFSTGRRGCVGSELGTEMMVMLLARLLHGFTWSLPPGILTVDLSESTHDLSLSKPLVLQAKPRLAAQLYPIN